MTEQSKGDVMEPEEIRTRCFSAYNIGKKLCGWHPGDIIEAQVRFLMEEEPDEFPDEDKARLFACEDYDLLRLEWEYLCDHITELMEERDLDSEPLHIEVSNFGWRRLSGKKLCWAEDGATLLQKTLPDTENFFDIYGYDKGLAINNRHHDSPWGREWYYITAVGPTSAVMEIEPGHKEKVLYILGFRHPYPGFGEDEVIFTLGSAELCLGYKCEVYLKNTPWGPIIEDAWYLHGRLEMTYDNSSEIHGPFELETDDGIMLTVEVKETNDG